MIKKILYKSLTLLARAYLWRFKPTIVAITGNVGKTSTKDAIAAVLKSKMHIRATGGNLNTKLGVALTIMGDWADEYYSTTPNFNFWLRIFLRGLVGFVIPQNYPEILVLEFGADKPGDIKFLAERYGPHVAVVTAIGQIPVHVVHFSGPEELAREKSELVKALGPQDYAILNQDDLAVFEMKNRTRAKIRTYGFTDGATFKISNLDFAVNELQRKPEGINFKINHGQGFTPFKINNALGKTQAYAAAAAAAVGLVFDINLVDSSTALTSFTGPKGRLRVLAGVKNTTIIDDTYNAAPAATHAALEVLKGLPAKRKIAVLGDMLELGKYTLQAHEEIGNIAGDIADILVCVGEKAKFIADAAGNQLAKENIYTFHNSDEAKLKVQELLEEDDLILVKGSQGMRMEKIVEEIMAEPERKEELLVRQNGSWKRK